MPHTLLSPEPLEQVHELNRLFLRSLQAGKPEVLSGAGFPSAALGALRKATPQQLDGIAEFPRTLFELVIDAPVPRNGAASPRSGGPHDSVAFTSRILELTVAYCAWTTCRDSAYHARLFFGLGTDVIHTLRTTPISKLPWLAMTRARVVCAFRDAECLWRELLLETRPEARRQLVLVALQPALRPPRRLQKT